MSERIFHIEVHRDAHEDDIARIRAAMVHALEEIGRGTGVTMGLDKNRKPYIDYDIAGPMYELRDDMRKQDWQKFLKAQPAKEVKQIVNIAQGMLDNDS